MREIKFRMWNPFRNHLKGGFHTETGQVIECLKQQIRHQNGERLGYNHIADGCIFEQYTGLKDKNGREIYEGDIVEIENDGQVITICEKKPGYFTLIDRAGGEWTRQFFHQPERLSVIGNIHENPELLNSEEEETGNN